MKGETRERWEQLCQLAADEHDPERLMELVTEINRLLSEKVEKEQRLKAKRENKKEQGAS